MGAARRQALRWHPDKNAERLALATERFKALAAAYETIGNDEARAR